MSASPSIAADGGWSATTACTRRSRRDDAGSAAAAWWPTAASAPSRWSAPSSTRFPPHAWRAWTWIPRPESGRILERFGRGDVDILLGTQMIAKGLDFPRVTLVGVVNADVGMNLPDFRASERTFQLLTQVAGRAGRAGRGTVLVQTAAPGHYAIERAIRHDYLGFARTELEERRGPCYPPHCRLVNVVVSGTEEAAVHDAAVRAGDWTARRLAAAGAGTVAMLGPAPCPIDRIRGRWRQRGSAGRRRPLAAGGVRRPGRRRPATGARPGPGHAAVTGPRCHSSRGGANIHQEASPGAG